MKNRKSALLKASVVTGITLVAILVLPIGFFLLVGLRIKSDPSLQKRRYSLNEITNLRGSSFKSLNSIVYPGTDLTKNHYDVDKEYVNAVNNFASEINAEISSGDENKVYSPLGLYAELDIASSLSDDASVLSEFDNLLGVSAATRNGNYKNMFLNNFYVTENGTTQMYNGLFVTSDYTFNDSLLSILNNKYTEAYQMNFRSDEDISALLKWIDAKTDSSSYLDKESLEPEDDTSFILCSTLYFKNRWDKQFTKQNSYKDSFYGKNDTSSVTFMRHTYTGKAYDYDTYYSFYDYYKGGYSIKYLIPKNEEDDIFALTEGKNIFTDDEEKALQVETYQGILDSSLIIDLSVPKFSVDYSYDFTSSLKKMGLTKAFEENGKAFNYLFNNLPEQGSAYLSYVKQKNSIVLDEDGTLAKSVTFSMGMSKGTAYVSEDTLEVKLNQPFIYVIMDDNGLPLYTGSVTQL